MTLKNEIEKTMFKEGIEDRIQDIATFMDIPVENVKKRLKTLTFSDYIKVMNSLKTQDKDNIERIMGMPARDPNWKSPIDDIDDEEEQHRRDVKHGLYGDDEEEDESEDDKEQHRRDVKHGLYGDVDEAKILEDRVFKVRDIDWDTEDSSGEGPEGLNLPKSLIVNVPKAHLDSYEDTEEFISDFISNVTGFTHKGYSTDPEIPQDIAKTVTKQHTLPRIDTEKYQERDGLEGPFMTKSGKVVYYDSKEGSYYDPDTDIYLSYEEWKELGESEYLDHFDSMAAEIQKEGILHYSDAKGTPKYSEGYKAAKDGVKYDENPYRGIEKLQWSRGHNDERADRLRAAGEPNYGARGQFEDIESDIYAQDTWKNDWRKSEAIVNKYFDGNEDYLEEIMDNVTSDDYVNQTGDDYFWNKHSDIITDNFYGDWNWLEAIQYWDEKDIVKAKSIYSNDFQKTNNLKPGNSTFDNRRRDSEIMPVVRRTSESEDEDGVSAEDLVDIITHRIKMNKELMLSLLGDEGPGPLMRAIEEVAEFHSGTTEVGSSDVSIMVKEVIKSMFPLDYRKFDSEPYGKEK